MRLFFEFFKVGLFSVGGGLATIPFLTDIGARTGWFSPGELANMIAVSESTPGPMGVNMATYVGFETAGVAGAVTATLGLVAPSVVVILIIAGFLQKFRQSRGVEAVFYGIRPASTGLIVSAGLTVASIALLAVDDASPNSFSGVHWGAAALAATVFVCMKWTPLKKLHPVVFIALSAAAGVLFQL